MLATYGTAKRVIALLIKTAILVKQPFAEHLPFHSSYCSEHEFTEKCQMQSDLCVQGCRAEAAPSQGQQRCPRANRSLTPRYRTPRRHQPRAALAPGLCSQQVTASRALSFRFGKQSCSIPIPAPSALSATYLLTEHTAWSP